MTANTLRDAVRRAARGLRGRGGELTPADQPLPARPERLLTMPLFSDLSPSEAAILSLFVTRAAVAAGTVVVQQGGQDADFYLIEEGRAEVRLRDEAGREKILATLGPGDYFGEIAFVTGGTRTADVVATTPMTLLRLGREGYEALTQVAAAEELTRIATTRAEATRAERERGRDETPAG